MTQTVTKKTKSKEECLRPRVAGELFLNPFDASVGLHQLLLAAAFDMIWLLTQPA